MLQGSSPGPGRRSNCSRSAERLLKEMDSAPTSPDLQSVNTPAWAGPLMVPGTHPAQTVRQNRPREGGVVGLECLGFRLQKQGALFPPVRWHAAWHARCWAGYFQGNMNVNRCSEIRSRLGGREATKGTGLRSRSSKKRAWREHGTVLRSHGCWRQRPGRPCAAWNPRVLGLQLPAGRVFCGKHGIWNPKSGLAPRLCPALATRPWLGSYFSLPEPPFLVCFHM